MEFTETHSSKTAVSQGNYRAPRSRIITEIEKTLDQLVSFLSPDMHLFFFPCPAEPGYVLPLQTV